MVEEREGSAEPLPVSEQSALADPGSGATTATAGQEGGAGNSPEGNDDVRLTSKLLSGETAPSSGCPSAPPILTVPVVAVPCFLAPAALIESPGFTALGQLAIAHPAVLATVTTQAHVQMQTAYSPSGTMATAGTAFPHPRLPTDSSVSSQQTSPVAEISSGDVYHWRKYGQKQVKNTENFRSYYRCANSNCLAKKKVECSPEGKICEVIYRGKHDHDPPQKNRNSRERGSQSAGPSKESGGSQILRNEPNELDPSACKNNPADETPDQQLHRSNDCERDARIAIQKDLAEEPDPKRRLSENSKSSITPRDESSKTVREYIVQSETDSKKLGDGYRWRKYGQKFVKGNPNPRSYYRCTHDGCPVRKHVERASHDAKALLITYEGKHNHYQPRGPILKCANDQVAKESPVPTAGKEGDASSSLLAKISSEDMNPNDTVKKLAGDKVSEFGGDKSPTPVSEFGGDKSPTPSCAQSLTNVEEDGERIEPDGMRNSLLNGNPAAVQVKNS